MVASAAILGRHPESIMGHIVAMLSTTLQDLAVAASASSLMQPPAGEASRRSQVRASGWRMVGSWVDAPRWPLRFADVGPDGGSFG